MACKLPKLPEIQKIEVKLTCELDVQGTEVAVPMRFLQELFNGFNMNPWDIKDIPEGTRINAVIKGKANTKPIMDWGVTDNVLRKENAKGIFEDCPLSMSSFVRVSWGVRMPAKQKVETHWELVGDRSAATLMGKKAVTEEEEITFQCREEIMIYGMACIWHYLKMYLTTPKENRPGAKPRNPKVFSEEWQAICQKRAISVLEDYRKWVKEEKYLQITS